MKQAALLVLLAVAMQIPAPAPTFRTAVETVRLDVSVTKNGVPVKGLTAADFVVTDEGTRQVVETVSLERMPLSVQLVLDTSGSVVGDRLQQLASAGVGLVNSLRDGDEAGLVTFGGLVRIAAPMSRDLMPLREALASLKAGGQTAVRDAVQIALSMPHADAARPMMLLFTDGLDGASWLTEEDAIGSARITGSVIHVVRVEGDAGGVPRFLSRLASATGGRTWSAASPRDLGRLFNTVLEEMRGRYLLSFTPTSGARRGWHDVKVTVRSGGDVNARPGYFKP